MALILVALGTATLAAMATAVGRGLVVARHDATATALTLARLDELRAGPRASGSDTPASSDGTPFTREWTAQAGRGHPDTLAATVAWANHRITLATEARP